MSNGDALKKIIEGLAEKEIDKGTELDNEKMGEFLLERNKRIVFPPYTTTRFKKPKTDETTETTEE